MHDNNPFQNIKDYWGSYYSSITESAEKHLADFAGYAVYKDGKWYQSEGDVKKGKGISSDELWNRHGDEYKRHLDSRKGANEDKDSRDGESTRSEEVEYDGKQLGEAKRRPKVEPIGGNTAPYGYHERVSPSGRKRYIPKTKEEWEAESEEFHKNNPNHWQNVERFQRENPLNPVRVQQYTGVDDHLPGGGAAALERSRAAFARPLESKKIKEAIELLSEGSSMDNKYSNKSYNSMENKPSTSKMEKPTKPVAKPSAQGRATNSPVVKFGKRTTSRRYVTRANRWALRQIAKNKSAVSETPIEENLFHKDSDRLLREHIRAEYEARGIYPTSREVQETYNMVMDLLEKTRASERDAILAQKHGTSGTASGMILTKQELRRQRAGNPPQDYGDPQRTSREEVERQGAHLARRRVPTRVSPSSGVDAPPARPVPLGDIFRRMIRAREEGRAQELKGMMGR